MCGSYEKVSLAQKPKQPQPPEDVAAKKKLSPVEVLTSPDDVQHHVRKKVRTISNIPHTPWFRKKIACPKGKEPPMRVRKQKVRRKGRVAAKDPRGLPRNNRREPQKEISVSRDQQKVQTARAAGKRAFQRKKRSIHFKEPQCPPSAFKPEKLRPAGTASTCISDEALRSALEKIRSSRQKLTDFKKKYQELALLGNGGYGSVYAGIRKADLFLVAVKHIPLRRVLYKQLNVHGEVISVPLEILLLLMACEGEPHSSGLLRLLDWYKGREELILVLERPEQCLDAYEYIFKKQHRFSVAEVMVIIKQVAEALLHIHCRGVVHRDLKPENILVSRGKGRLQAYLVDFGCGELRKSEPFLKLYCNTGYAAPESYTRKEYRCEPFTVWQLGINIYLLLSTRVPFGKKREVVEMPPDLTHSCFNGCRDLLLGCLAKNPEERFTLEDVVKHPWVQGLRLVQEPPKEAIPQSSCLCTEQPATPVDPCLLTFVDQEVQSSIRETSSFSNYVLGLALEKIQTGGQQINVFKEKYKQLSPLGSGGYGKVYTGLRKSDIFPVAIKHITMSAVFYAHLTLHGEGISAPLEVLLMLMAGVGEPCPKSCVSLLDWYQDEDELIIVMERPERCQDLFDYLYSKPKGLPRWEAKVITKQVAQALLDLHRRGVVHRDLKLNNILISQARDGLHTYLIDFGCGELRREEPFCELYCHLEAAAPEIFTKKKYDSEPFTVWQFGVMIYQLLTKKIPFRSESKVLEADPSVGSWHFRGCRDMILGCLSKNPKRRLTLEQIVNHPWIKGRS